MGRSAEVTAVDVSGGDVEQVEDPYRHQQKRPGLAARLLKSPSRVPHGIVNFGFFTDLSTRPGG
jgi:hypothetical protein